MSQIRKGFTFSSIYQKTLDEQVLAGNCENCHSFNVLEGIPNLSVPERSCIACLLLASKRAFDCWLDNIQIHQQNDNLQEQLSKAVNNNTRIKMELCNAQAECLSLHQQLLKVQEKGEGEIHSKPEPASFGSPSAHASAAGFKICFGTVIWPCPTVRAIFPWSHEKNTGLERQLCKSQTQLLEVREKGESETPFTTIHPKPGPATFGSPSAHVVSAGISFGTIDWPWPTLYPVEPKKATFHWST